MPQILYSEICYSVLQCVILERQYRLTQQVMTIAMETLTRDYPEKAAPKGTRIKRHRGNCESLLAGRQVAKVESNWPGVG